MLLCGAADKSVYAIKMPPSSSSSLRTLTGVASS